VHIGRTLARPALRIAVGIAVLLLVPAIATLTGDADWSAGDFVLAAVLLAVVGVGIELTVCNAGNLATCAGIGAVGVAAAVLGEADDAPGLVLLGLLLLASAGMLTTRILRRIR
jgi:hypothetical protein